MVLKTRDKLIDVARQLFARKGIENTTMNDIAQASSSGRRTIYTYFRNKREIYNAVIEQESEQLVSKLRAVVEDPSLTPPQKLRRYLNVRIDIVEQATVSHKKPADSSSLRAFFDRDMRRLEKIRRLAVVKESELLHTLMEEGIASGDFDSEQTSHLPTVEQILFQGIDYSHIRNNFKDFSMTAATLRCHIVDFIVKAVVIEKSEDNKQ